MAEHQRDPVGEVVIEPLHPKPDGRLIAHVTAEDEVEVPDRIRDEGEVGVHDRLHPIVRRLCQRGALVDPGDQPFAGGIEDGEIEVQLPGEVLVEGRLGHPRVVGDLVHARGVVATGNEDVPGRVEEFAASLLAGLAPGGRRPRHAMMLKETYPPAMTTDLLPVPAEVQDIWLPNALIAARHVPATTTAPPAVYLHGLGGSSLNWTDLMYALDSRVDGWALDLAGFGSSPPPRDGDLTPAGHARLVASFIEHQLGQPAHVFGNSMGGAVAVQLAARRPDLVRTLTLISPAMPDLRPRRGSVHLPVIAIPGLGERLVDRYAQLDASKRVKATIDSVFADPGRVSPQRIQEAVDELSRRDHLTYGADAVLRSLRGLLRSYLDRGPNRPWKLAERVQSPTLAIYGQRDGLVDASRADRITKHFRQARVVILADCGHVAQMEHPEWVAGVWESAFPQA